MPNIYFIQPSYNMPRVVDALQSMDYAEASLQDWKEASEDRKVFVVLTGVPNDLDQKNINAAVVVDDPVNVYQFYKDHSPDASPHAVEVAVSHAYELVEDLKSHGVDVVYDKDIASLAGWEEHKKSSLILKPNQLATEIYRNYPDVLGNEAEWPFWLFLYPGIERLDSEDGLEIDLTGRARTILYGPYIRLLPGEWEITAELRLLPGAGGIDLMFEWGEGEDFSTLPHTVTEEGLYRVCLKRIWHSSAPAEFRVTTLRPHFEGLFQLTKAKVRHVAALSAAE